MKEINGNRKSEPAQVLRAGDVIPPFDKDTPPANVPESGSEEPTLAQARVQQPKRERKARRVQETGPEAGHVSLVEPATPQIPTYDLAENILAGQRRTAARRRKAPGRTQTEPERNPVMTRVIEPPSQDLRELQQIVAEIVARDMERLCGRPGTPAYE